MARETIELQMIPPPEGTFGPKQALAWLKSEAQGYLWILRAGLAAPDEKTRGAATWLCYDLQDMLEACAAAIESDKSVTVMARGVEGAFCAGSLQAAPLVLATREFAEDSIAELDATYAKLARHLAQRLDAAEYVRDREAA